MRFVYGFTIPADTAKVSAEELDIPLVKGVLTRVEIGFPPGPAALVHVVVRDGSFQIAPVNPESSFAWDDYNDEFNMSYDLTEVGHRLTLVGWSPDTVYQHTVTFRFDVEPAEKGSERELIRQFVKLIGLGS